MKFVKLTNYTEKTIFVNTDQIIIITMGEKFTYIIYTNGLTDYVKESPEEIMEMIHEQPEQKEQQ